MMRFRTWILGAIALSMATLASSEARADGLAAKTDALPAAERAQLASDIAAAKARHPEAFQAVADVKGHLPEGYNRYRNPVPEVGRELTALGPSALLPMLEALAFTTPARPGNNDAERNALAVGLLRATGKLRDARSAPVFKAVLEGSSTDPHVLRAAAEGLGILCGKADLATLKKHTGEQDPLKIAAIHGLGQCRTLESAVESAKHLASLLASTQDTDTAEAVAHALGSIGSPSAWASLGPAAETTGQSVRAIAADALFQGFVSRQDSARLRIQKSILIISPPDADERIQRARGQAPADSLKALDALQRQLNRRRR